MTSLKLKPPFLLWWIHKCTLQGQFIPCERYFFNGDTQIWPCNLHLCLHHKRNGNFDFIIHHTRSVTPECYHQNEWLLFDLIAPSAEGCKCGRPQGCMTSLWNSPIPWISYCIAGNFYRVYFCSFCSTMVNCEF